jgi:hypothetical protein
MADERHASDEELRQIIVGAIAAAPPLAGVQPGVWIGKVNEAIPFVAAMMGDGSRQFRTAKEVATADVFVAVYRSHSVEQSSTRVVVEFIGERSDSKPETIRTHRTDTAAGRAMQARLDKLAAGDRLVFYKAFEEITGGANAGRKARTLVHFETLPARSADTQQAATPGTPIPGRAPAAQPPPAPPDVAGGGDPDFGPAPDTPPPRGPGADDIDNDLAATFNALTAKVKVNVVRRLRESEIDFPTPQQDKIDAFLAIIRAEERTEKARNPADG